jgi:DNA polymerase III delta prime subunit
MCSAAEKSIVSKLEYFRENNKIPHILFYGPTHSNKDLLVSDYIQKIYGFDKVLIKQNVLFVSCSGKGIKFIRDEIKTFSKMHIQQSEAATVFKTVVLLNADFLTDDAQSALRRSIELFSYNTRFFLLVENRSRLLKPILSRFCEMYVPPAEESGSANPSCKALQEGSYASAVISADMAALRNPCESEIMNMAARWVEAGLSSYDFLAWLETDGSDENVSNTVVNRVLNTRFLFHRLKQEYRCEKLFLWTLLDFYFFRGYDDLVKMASL